MARQAAPQSAPAPASTRRGHARSGRPTRAGALGVPAARIGFHRGVLAGRGRLQVLAPAGNRTRPAAPWIAGAPAPARRRGCRTPAPRASSKRGRAAYRRPASPPCGRAQGARRRSAAASRAGRRPPARRRDRDEPLQRRADVEREQNVERVDRRHRHALAGVDDQQSVRDQTLHRLAHRRAAEPDRAARSCSVRRAPGSSASRTICVLDEPVGPLGLRLLGRGSAPRQAPDPRDACGVASSSHRPRCSCLPPALLPTPASLPA